MPKVRVKDGCTYGAGGKYPAGTVLQVTDAEVVSFGDKLEVLELDVETSPLEESESEATPAAARLAEQEGVDLGGVEGTGTGGKVTKADVQKVVSG